jgi:hypothetical protein
MQMRNLLCVIIISLIAINWQCDEEVGKSEPKTLQELQLELTRRNADVQQLLKSAMIDDRVELNGTRFRIEGYRVCDGLNLVVMVSDYEVSGLSTRLTDETVKATLKRAEVLLTEQQAEIEGFIALKESMNHSIHGDSFPATQVRQRANR